MATPEPTGYSELGGLRAWLAEVDRVLGLRTRIGLVLLALAIGLGAAALYLALDTRDNAADAGDVAALQKRVRALEQERAGAAAGLRVEVAAARSAADAARTQVSDLQKRVGALERQAAAQAPQGPAGGGAGRRGPTGSTGPTGATRTNGGSGKPK
jgi:hypothetical protein